MAIGPAGDSNNVPVGECAVRLARKGNNLKFILSVVSFRSIGKSVLATVKFRKLPKDSHFAGSRLPNHVSRFLRLISATIEFSAF